MLGFGGPQSLALQHQATWEGPLGVRPRVRVCPQEAGRPDPWALLQAEGQAEMRALASRSVGPTVLARGAFVGRRGLRGPYMFSRPE